MLDEGVSIQAFGGCVRLDDGVLIGRNCVIFGQGGVTIGRDTMLAPHVVIASTEHVYWDEGSVRSQGFTRERVSIGSGVWIGALVAVLAGVTIGDNCVVGAGSVVTRDLPAGYVCAGSPARPLKSLSEGKRDVQVFRV